MRWNLGIIVHLRAASRNGVAFHRELAVHQWIGPSVVCDGRVIPKLFLARNKRECADHIRTVTYRFKKGGNSELSC